MKKTVAIVIIGMVTMTTMKAGDNPFFTPFSTPHGTAPFDKIKTEHYEPAFEKAIAEHQQEINAIADNPEPPTFANTIEAMEYSGEMLNRVSN
ncbi:MAG: peptidase M3, partial [Dysgonamonadaceae bacterium]